MVSIAIASGHTTIDPTSLLTWLTCLTILGGAGIAVLRWGRKFVRMLDDFAGEPERPGVPRRAGVMERMQGLEKSQLRMTESLATIQSEVTYNHGGSLKDGVKGLDTRLERVESDVKGIHERLDKQVSP